MLDGFVKNALRDLLPQKALSAVKKVNDTVFDGTAIKSYSQQGEDMILRNIFEGQKKGFYVDVGAHHPKRFSNTYLFYKMGWRGINIDAMPGGMKAFNKIRPGDVNLEVAISNKKETLTYYVFDEPALNGFSKDLSEERIKKGNHQVVAKVDLETSTLEEILDVYLPEGQEIDFLSVDMEGFDLHVLQSNNWEKYRPKFILVESLEFDMEKMEEDGIYKYTRTKGYSLYAKAVTTLIFKRNSIQALF